MLPPAATAWGWKLASIGISGQVPEGSRGGVPEGFESQCEQAWRNVIAVLNSAGLGVEHLVKINTFLTDKSQVCPIAPFAARCSGETNPHRRS